MTGIELFNAITKMEEDLIDKKTTDRNNSRVLPAREKSAAERTFAVAASFFLLVFIAAGITAVNLEQKRLGNYGLLSDSTDTVDVNVEVPVEWQKISMHMDWPYYETAEEIREASSQIYVGKVTDVSFTVLDGKTGAEDLDPASESTSRMFYTVYSVDIAREYRGESRKTVKIAVIGGLSGVKESEQFRMICDSGLNKKYNGIPIVAETNRIGLSIGQEYLFCVNRVGEYDHIISPNQFVYDVRSKDAKAIIACCE